MAEEGNNVQTEGVDTQEEQVVKAAELTRRIKKEQERYEARIAELEKQKEKEKNDAVEKARVEATLTGKELEKYKEQEAERKEKQYLDRIAELELEHTRRGLKDEAIRTLSEKNLPINEKLLQFVVKDTAEDTLKAIDDMAELLSVQKNEYAKGTAPRNSGGYGTGTEKETDIFDKAKITGF